MHSHERLLVRSFIHLFIHSFIWSDLTTQFVSPNSLQLITSIVTVNMTVISTCAAVLGVGPPLLKSGLNRRTSLELHRLRRHHRQLNCWLDCRAQ